MSALQSRASTAHIVNAPASHVELRDPASSETTRVSARISQVSPKTDASVHASRSTASVFPAAPLTTPKHDWSQTC